MAIVYDVTVVSFLEPDRHDPHNRRQSLQQLSQAERTVWRDPDLLARIESVLDDPSLAVPLDEAGSSASTAANKAGTPPGHRGP